MLVLTVLRAQIGMDQGELTDLRRNLFKLKLQDRIFLVWFKLGGPPGLFDVLIGFYFQVFTGYISVPGSEGSASLFAALGSPACHNRMTVATQPGIKQVFCRRR